MQKHKTTNVIYGTQSNQSLIGRHNKRGQQVNIPASTRNSKLTDQRYYNRKLDTLPRHFDNTLLEGWKKHGNVIHSIHKMHTLAKVNKYGVGVVVPQRAIDTKAAYFENKVGI